MASVKVKYCNDKRRGRAKSWVESSCQMPGTCAFINAMAARDRLLDMVIIFIPILSSAPQWQRRKGVRSLGEKGAGIPEKPYDIVT